MVVFEKQANQGHHVVGSKMAQEASFCESLESRITVLAAPYCDIRQTWAHWSWTNTRTSKRFLLCACLWELSHDHVPCDWDKATNQNRSHLNFFCRSYIQGEQISHDPLENAGTENANVFQKDKNSSVQYLHDCKNKLDARPVWSRLLFSWN